MRNDISSATSGQVMHRILILLAALMMLLFVFSISTTAQEDSKPKNLKVLDKDISHDDLMEVMDNFQNALGVGCDHCHVRGEAPPGQRAEMDFASDAKKEKLTARVMLQMVDKLNSSYLADLPIADPSPVKVECVTCHHGQPRPVQIQDLLRQVHSKHGMAALDSTYRSLRDEYYGSATYDFGEVMLVRVAFDFFDKSSDDALAVLKLNQEFYPKSATTEWAMGRVYVERGDTATAITEFKKALDINPNYRRAAHDLQMLGVEK